MLLDPIRRLFDWIRHLLYRLVALPQPAFYTDNRYPRTAVGGLRFWREQIAYPRAQYYEFRLRRGGRR